MVSSRDPFNGCKRDLQLGDEKVTLNHHFQDVFNYMFGGPKDDEEKHPEDEKPSDDDGSKPSDDDGSKPVEEPVEHFEDWRFSS